MSQKLFEGHLKTLNAAGCNPAVTIFITVVCCLIVSIPWYMHVRLPYDDQPQTPLSNRLASAGFLSMTQRCS